MSDLPFIVSDGFNRPSNTTQYAQYDLVANNATAASVFPLKFKVSRNKNDGMMIRKARIEKSSTPLTSAQFRLYIFRTSPVVSVGDNAALNTSGGALAIADVSNLAGWFEVTMDRSGTAGAVGRALPAIWSEIIVAPGDDEFVYGLLEAMAGYTPASAEAFQVRLECLR